MTGKGRSPLPAGTTGAFGGVLTDAAARALRAPARGLGRCGAPEPPGAGAAALAAALRREAECTAVLAVAPGPAQLESLAADLRAMMRADEPLRMFPMLDLAEDDPVAAAARLAVLSALSPAPAGGGKGGARPPAPKLLVATCVQALMQPSPDPARTEKMSLRLAPGGGPGPEALRAWLEENGYRREPEVYEAGVYAVKGGITDVWPAAAGVPSRIEYFGDEIDSMRTFDPATQRSAAPLESLRIPPRKLPVEARRPLTDFLPDGATVLWCGGEGLDEAAAAFAETAALPPRRRLEAVRTALDARPSVRQVFLGLPLPEGVPAVSLPFRPIDDADSAGDFAPTPDWMENHRRDRLERLAAESRRTGARLVVCLDTRGALEHLRDSAPPPGAELRVAPISGGVCIVAPGDGGSLSILAQSDLYGIRPRVRGAGTGVPEELLAAQLGVEIPAGEDPDEAAETAAEAIAARLFDRFSPGDAVVHLNHGIGRYLGTEDVAFGGTAVESMVLEYAGGTKLYVPMSQAHLVSRYSGVGDAPVRLHALSGKRWAGEKAAAANAVQELALGMLRRQARRKALPGRPFAHETPYLEAFEASFPYRETPGQAECIRAVRADMESPHPMDRLVCGDAGYGKTEVALRAAFICAMQGRQVAVLVPTTVLAQQHAATFRERLADYPLSIAVHSRFATQAERDAALAGAADGTVDILVGTHGILGPNVRFKDLGLVIIDEEQRFGVRDKERLKEISEMVDVLTLSATPIPRSLYLGLTGARDLSLLRTPPPGRVAAETRVLRDTDETVKAAVTREIARGGQVFFLHNRVMTIGLVESRLRRLLPGVRIAVAHGRLSPREVKGVVDSFARGEADLLLSTTIIENGIDIPRANTILVDRADRFGIADLYQLRGRVGRGATKAYAYFLVPSESLLTSDAKERLEALARASRLGGGVSLALRDLSLRGAGNLLGAEQSGHIGAVGFQLYSKLLRHAVARLKGETLPKEARAFVELPFLSEGETADPARAPALLPRDYVDDDARRVEFHRRLAECATDAQLAALEAETEDRFGQTPEPLRRLYRLAALRIAASDRGIERVEMRDGALRLVRDGAPVRFRGALPRPAGRTPDDLLASVERLVRVQPVRPAAK